MNDVGFAGVGELLVTFKASELTKDADEGKPVKVSESGTVALCSDGEDMIGVVKWIASDGTTCSVQLKGAAAVPYNDDGELSTPTVNYSALVADGAGKLKVDVSGISYRILAIDTTAKTIIIML